MISEIFLFHLEANYEVDVIYLFSVSIKWFLKFIDKPICGLMNLSAKNEISNPIEGNYQEKWKVKNYFSFGKMENKGKVMLK